MEKQIIMGICLPDKTKDRIEIIKDAIDREVTQEFAYDKICNIENDGERIYFEISASVHCVSIRLSDLKEIIKLVKE